jgi:hypothetical protein
MPATTSVSGALTARSPAFRRRGRGARPEALGDLESGEHLRPAGLPVVAEEQLVAGDLDLVAVDEGCRLDAEHYAVDAHDGVRAAAPDRDVVVRAHVQ